MIWDLLGVFGKVRNSQKLLADDNIDKLNRSFTVIFLLIAAAFIWSKNFGLTITCLKPAVDHAPIPLDYVNALCWVQDVRRYKDIFNNAIRDDSKSINTNTYAWLMLIIAFVAFIFYLPYLLWKLFIRKNTYQNVPIDINSIVNSLRGSSLERKDDFATNITTVADYLDRCFSLNNFNDGYLDEHDDFSTNLIKKPDGKSTNKEPKSYFDRIKKRKVRFFYVPLFIKYLFIKLIYLAISLSVFYFLKNCFKCKNHFIFSELKCIPL